jgi:hypothetical protein
MNSEPSKAHAHKQTDDNEVKPPGQLSEFTEANSL